MELNRKRERGQFWYFRFSEDLMFSYDFRKMENKPGGYEFIVILLKIYAISIRNSGKFAIEAKADGTLDIVDFADIINHKPKAVEEALTYFSEEGLIVPVERDESEFVFKVPMVENKIGSSSKQADYMRGYRALHEGNKPKALPDEGDKEEPGKPAEKKLVYGILQNVHLTLSEYNELKKRYANAEKVIDRLSIYKGKKGTDLSGTDYAWVLSFAQTDGVVKESDSEKRYACYERYKREALAGYPPPDSARAELTELQYEELERIAEEAWENEKKKESQTQLEFTFNKNEAD